MHTMRTERSACADFGAQAFSFCAPADTLSDTALSAVSFFVVLATILRAQITGRVCSAIRLLIFGEVKPMPI